MSMTTKQYAALAKDVYKEPLEIGVDSKAVKIGDSSYKRLEYVDHPSGYQGILYQRLDTSELIVAHRGTEPGREPLRDGLVTDGGMVTARHNAQAADAIEFTRHALEYAEKSSKGLKAPEVTVTGHSLGGGLAEITAHYFGLKGETFNGYGSVSLDRRIPEGGHDVINHVMAGDPVSAASRHYGQVRVYATAQEIVTLEQAGYDDHHGGLRNPINAVRELVMDSHGIDNFLPVDQQGKPHHSVLEDTTAHDLAQRHAPMIERYRDDVATLRVGVTLGARGWGGLLQDGISEFRGPLAPGAGRDTIGVPNWAEHMQQLHDPNAHGTASPTQEWHAPLKANASAQATSAGYVDDPLYRLFREKLSADIPAATVLHATVEARREGMHRPEHIDQVLEHGGRIWIKGEIPGCKARVETGGPIPSIEESLRQMQVMEEQRPQAEHVVRQPAALTR